MSTVRLYDAHNHLQDERFGGRQAELVAACRAEGIMGMVVNGACEADWPAVADLAARFPDLVRPSFGYHPWYVSERSPGWQDTLVRFLDRYPGAGVGEIGLDRWKPGPESSKPGSRCDQVELGALSFAGFEDSVLARRADRDLEKERGVVGGRMSVGQRRASLDLAAQEEVFVWQLRLAAERNLPASIHCLQAWGRLFDLLRAGPRPVRGFLLHSYGGSEEMVAPLAKLGAYFSLPGYFAHERKHRQRAAFKAVPRDRLLIETDAPDQCLPVAGAGREAGTGGHSGLERYALRDLTSGKPINHPANLAAVYEFTAGLVGEPVGVLAEQVETNFRRLFAGAPS